MKPTPQVMGKKYLKNNYLTLLLLFVVLSGYAQMITVNDSFSPQQLIENNLIQGCVEVSNISSQVNGNINGITSYGYFEKDLSNFPFENGIILSTGRAVSAGNTVNTNILNEGEDNWGTNTDLENALGISNTFNATSIEFDFVSISNLIQFRYILASEEYFGNFPCQYSDGFAFLIKQAGTTDPYTNIAVIPETTIPVNTNTIHDAIAGFCDEENSDFFEGYNIGDTNYNGRTTVLTATANILPNVLYHIKLIIADQSDENYDSAVFIEGNSFNPSVDLGDDVTTCAESYLIDGDIQNPLASYTWKLNGQVITGANDPTFDAPVSGVYEVEITIPLNDIECTIQDTMVLTLNSEQPAGDISDLEQCDAGSDNVETFDLTLKEDEIIGVMPPANYTIQYFETQNNAFTNTNPISSGSFTNTSNPQTIYVSIRDDQTGCLAYTSFNLVLNPLPDIGTPSAYEVCDDTNPDGFTTFDLETLFNDDATQGDTSLVVTYHSTPMDAESGDNPLPMPYVNTNLNETVYIRVENPDNGCANTTSVSLTVIETPSVNASDIPPLNACESDGDGFDSFDLTELLDDVIGSLTGVTVTFHTSYQDAQTGNDPVGDPTSFDNTIQDVQTIYIRVEDDVTGCATVVNTELHTNLLITGTDIRNFETCDDESSDGVVEFDLEDIGLTIANDLEDVTVTFYETQLDLDNQTNPIDQSVPYVVTSSPHTIFLEISSPDCTHETQINLITNPPLLLGPIPPQTYCDTNQNGFINIYLPSFNTVTTEGNSLYQATYFLTEEDAIDNTNELPAYHNNVSNPQTYWVRVINLSTGCVDTNSFEVTVLPAPATVTPDNIVVCDDDQDGLSIVNLTSVESQLISSTAGYTITYHLSQQYASVGQNPIPNPSAYNTETKSIFIRVENDFTGCFSIEPFEVIVNTLPIIPAIEDYNDCESDFNGIGEFVFEQKDLEILNGQTDKQVLYFETLQDAIDRTDIIDKTAIYNNISNPQQIFVRVENLTDENCFDTASFTIEVGSLPRYNIPSNFLICDDISNDGVEVFDLNEKILEMSQGINENLDITFYASMEDAENLNNPFSTLYTNVQNPQQVVARIENGTFCHDFAQFSLNVVQVPSVNLPSVMYECDDNFDGFSTFDLTVSELEILDVRNDDIVVTYFENEQDVGDDTEIIVDPENYNNISNPQIIYVQVTNTISQCYVSVPLEINVSFPPAINVVSSIDTCYDPSSIFDLTEATAILIDDVTDLNISYYLTESNAENQQDAIGDTFMYSSNSHTLYIRVDNTVTGCHSIDNFNLIIHQNPDANDPGVLQACDDVSNDMVADFDLTAHDLSIIGTQNAQNHTVTYYNSQEDAENTNNALNIPHAGAHGDIVFARIENDITGCFNTVSFELVVNEHPNLPSPIANCDDNYDHITTFDLTSAEAELFDIAQPTFVITYFENSSDLEADFNPINDPTNYTNLYNNQEVYIKVFNPGANCYWSVPLTLIGIVPPTINPILNIDTCENEDQSYDLNKATELLINNTTNVTVTYHASNYEAENSLNPLDVNYIYNSNSDTIYIRAEINTSGCYSISYFNLIVHPNPIAHMANAMETCDDDYDFVAAFDFYLQNSTILGAQDPSLFSINYFTSIEDAEFNTNPLSDTGYMAYDGQEIFARVENNNTGCYDISAFNVIVQRKPVVDIPDQVVCLDNLPLTITAGEIVNGDTYLWSTGATTSDIEIEDIGTYWVTVTTPFGCQTTTNFNVSESEAATIEFTETIDFSDPNNITISVSGIGNYMYILDDGEPQTSNVFENVTLGYHTIIIIDLNGCAEVSKEVVVIDAPKFFTPNGDNLHETWHISGVETLVGTVIDVFDRYGKLMTRLDWNSAGWDGTYNGNPMPTNDYWFVANVRKDNQQFQVKGHFTLKR
jgi:gliding motility-associated-like protein